MSDQSKAKDLAEDRLALVRDVHVRMSLRLQQAFGLRREEAIKIQPRWADRLRVLTHCGWDGIINRVQMNARPPLIG